jgi:NADPH2:quinone reductase
MKSIRVAKFGPPDVMKLVELPDPSPQAGQVLVRVSAAGVNPVDTYVRAGTYAMKPPLPYTPGSDGAGVVDAVGANMSRVKAGDRVYFAGTAPGFGAYATHTICAETQVHPLPDRVSFAQGAGIGVPYATAYRAIFHRAHARPGETVLVHGATGGVGLAAVQILVASGVRVVGTGGTEQGRALVKEQGAWQVTDHRAAGYLDELMRLTDGRGVDVVLEMLANVNLDKDLTVLAKGGRVVVIGSRGRVEIDPRGTMPKEAAILGMTMMGGGEAAVAEAHAYIVAGLRAGTLNPIVDEEIPLADAPRAHEEVMKNDSRGKIVLIA